MMIVTIQPINFIYFVAEPICDDSSAILRMADQLYREAYDWRMPACGAIQCHYQKDPLNVHSPRFNIALPVQSFAGNYDGVCHFKRTDLYRCVLTVHHGPLTLLAEARRKLTESALCDGLCLSHNDRDVQVVFDVQDPSANITMVQVGVA